MALLEALQSSWIKISTAVPQLVIEALPAIATSCSCRPSSGSCTIPFCSAQSLALPFSPHLPLNWVLSSGRAVSIHASSLCSSAAAFSIELESREQGVGLPGHSMKLHRMMLWVLDMLGSSCSPVPLTLGLQQADASPALGLLSRAAGEVPLCGGEVVRTAQRGKLSSRNRNRAQSSSKHLWSLSDTPPPMRLAVV